MARYCTYCGKPVEEIDKFCTQCGKSILSKIPQTENKTEAVIPEISHEKVIEKVEEITDGDGSEESIYSKPMKLTDTRISDLFKGEKLTFLVGAGCSVDSPSNLAAGKTMMDAIIDYTCPESEIEKIKRLEELRFEALVQIVRDQLDPDLKIIDYYGLCDKPNIQHFFLADMIKNGNFVITTNFDFLIEYALRKSGVPDDDIVSVITKEDFEKYKFPVKLFEEGRKTLYKIHGSTMNILKAENERDTRDSLIATIRAFGSNKEGQNVFQLESFKQPAFTNLTKDRSLVVMGYSGSDDFDIVPTLKILKNLKSVIWINFTHNLEMGNEKIYEIETNSDQLIDSLDKNVRKVNQILFDIKEMNSAEHIYRVDVNTSDFAAKLLKDQPELDKADFSIDVNDWIRKNVKKPDNLVEYYIASNIYLSFNEYNEAVRCANESLKVYDSESDYLFLLNYIGKIYYEQRDFPEALKRFEEVIAYRKKTGEMYGGDPILFYNMGMIYYKLKNYTKALNLIGESLQIERRIQEQRPSYHRRCFFGLGLIYKDVGFYSEALKWFDQALKFDEHIGDLSAKSKCLNSIGLILLEQKKYSEALERFELALKIADNLGDLAEKAISIKNIGNVSQKQENYEEALKSYGLALKINEQHGYLANKAIVLQNIGDIYLMQDNLSSALEKYEEAQKIFEDLNDLINVVNLQRNIGEIYQKQGDITKALEFYKKALPLIEQISVLTEKSTFDDDFSAVHRNLAQLGWKVEDFLQVQKREDIVIKNQLLNNFIKIYHQLENHLSKEQFVKSLNDYPNVLDCLTKGIKLKDIEFGALSGLAYCFTFSGSVYETQGRSKEALYCYEEALQIFRKMETTGLGITSDNFIMKFDTLMNIIDIYIKLQKYKDTLKLMEEALLITDLLGDKNKKVLCSNKIAQIFMNLGQYDLALQNYENSLKFFEELKDLKGKFNCLNGIAEIYYTQGKHSEALNYINEALKVANILEDSSMKFICLNFIAVIMREQENYPEALKSFEDGYQISKIRDDQKGMLLCISNIAELYKIQENYDEAQKNFEEALKLAENQKDPYSKASSLVGIAEINYIKKNYIDSSKQFGEAFQISNQLGEDELQLECILGITDLHMNIGNIQDAKQALEIGFQIIYKQMGMFSETPKDISSLKGNFNHLMQEIEKRWKRVNELLKNQGEKNP